VHLSFNFYLSIYLFIWIFTILGDATQIITVLQSLLKDILGAYKYAVNKS